MKIDPGFQKARNLFFGMVMEAGAGIEPAHEAFAEPGLTTWQPRHHHQKITIPLPTVGRQLKLDHP